MESRKRMQTGSDRDNKKGHLILYGARWRVPKKTHVYQPKSRQSEVLYVVFYEKSNYAQASPRLHLGVLTASGAVRSPVLSYILLYSPVVFCGIF